MEIKKMMTEKDIINENDIDIKDSKINVYKLYTYNCKWGDNKISGGLNVDFSYKIKQLQNEINECYAMIQQIMDGYENYNEYEKHKADNDVARYKSHIQSYECELTQCETSNELFVTNYDFFKKNNEILNTILGYNDIIFTNPPRITYKSEYDTYYIYGDGDIVIPLDYINEKQYAEEAFKNHELRDVIRKAHDYIIDFDKYPIDIVERNYVYYARCKNIVVFINKTDYEQRKKTIDALLLERKNNKNK